MSQSSYDQPTRCDQPTGYDRPSGHDQRTGWTWWITFAGVMMILPAASTSSTASSPQSTTNGLCSPTVPTSIWTYRNGACFIIIVGAVVLISGLGLFEEHPRSYDCRRRRQHQPGGEPPLHPGLPALGNHGDRDRPPRDLGSHGTRPRDAGRPRGWGPTSSSTTRAASHHTSGSRRIAVKGGFLIEGNP